MSDPFVAEIRIFPFDFAPTGWAMCNGQLLPLSQNTALFSLLGTVYGGDGKSTFALPNMQDSAPMQPGQGSGLAERFLGETGGTSTVTLLLTEIPLHTHSIMAASDIGNQNTPSDIRVPTISNNGSIYAPGNSAVAMMSPQALAPQGGSLPHNNMQPYMALNFCIALQGIFPARP